MSNLWYVIFGLTAIIILLLLFQPTRKPSAEKIQSLEYAIAISDQQKKYLEDKHKADSIAHTKELAQLRDSISKEQKHWVKLSSNLQALKSKPAVVKIIQDNLVVDSVFQQYDLILETKDNQISIQSKMIKSLGEENKRITANFLERLQLTEENYLTQKEIVEDYKKQLRKERRKKKLATVLIPVVGVAGLLLGSSL